MILSADFVTYRNKSVAGKTPPAVKCVVWDLDNSLWDGVLLENDEVNLKPRVKKLLETLDQRGILLSIASKNDHQSAWQHLEALEISTYFLFPQINWAPKSESIKAIARKLNIGLNTVAFIDDNPFELNEVAASIPEVACIDIRSIDSLLEQERFQGSKTADAQNRRRYYQEAIVREEKQVEFGSDYVQFLAFCEIRLQVEGYRAEDFDRVAELVQRTNQLNFSGRKYERAPLREMLDDPNVEKYSLHCSDKFGSYGLIGFALVRRGDGEIHIEDLMLSCRVQGKMVEQAFFSHLEEHHNPEGARRLRVNFKETRRNQPALQSLQAARFEELKEGKGFTREIRQHDCSRCDVIRVICRAGCENEMNKVAVESR
jgi:FkbH-like protein